MTRCARCDFATDPNAETTEAEQAAEHSLAASHPLCVVCHHSLDQSEQQACEKCLTNARADLAAITTLYAELPASSLCAHPSRRVARLVSGRSMDRRLRPLCLRVRSVR